MLALDIGIKHLAYCLSDISGNQPIIRHWSLVNLTDLQDTLKPTCIQCGKPAKAAAPAGLVCGRHIPKEYPQIFDEATGNPIKKMPTITQLQRFLRIKGLETKGKRPLLCERVKTIVTLPLIQKKSAMSIADNTCNLHNAIRDWITRDWQHLSTVKHVYIEHQPVLKNPVMKTVQLLIFATLRERLLALNTILPVQFHFVHAGKKFKGAETGDAGYKDRKAGAEARVKDYLSKFPLVSTQQDWLRWWLTQTKKDDLADTLCMILDIQL